MYVSTTIIVTIYSGQLHNGHNKLQESSVNPILGRICTTRLVKVQLPIFHGNRVDCAAFCRHTFVTQCLVSPGQLLGISDIYRATFPGQLHQLNCEHRTPRTSNIQGVRFRYIVKCLSLLRFIYCWWMEWWNKETK